MRHPPAQPRPDRGGRRSSPRCSSRCCCRCSGSKQAMKAKLESEADKLDSGQRGRIEGVIRSLDQPLRDDARGVARDAARPAQRRRPGLRRLVRGRAQPGARDRCRHVPPLSRPDRAVRECRRQAVARRGDHLGDAARQSGRATGGERRPEPHRRGPQLRSLDHERAGRALQRGPPRLVRRRGPHRHPPPPRPATRAAMASPFDYASADQAS